MKIEEVNIIVGIGDVSDAEKTGDIFFTNFDFVFLAAEKTDMP